jgi:outer membrane receptor for ferrienterochelin and colicins
LKHVAAILLLFIPTLLSPQPRKTGSIQGVVVSKETGQPLPGANVVVRGTLLGTITDSEGRFSLKNVPPGTLLVVVSMVGFERETVSQEVKEGETAPVTITLSSTTILIDPLVVTANKREQSTKEIPVSVSVLSAREISSRNSVALDDALRYVPGVHLTQSQVDIRGSTGYSRGVGTRVLLLADGLPLLTGDTGEIIWESLPVYQVDRVEIVKGAGSALYGSSALGGVINVITKEVGDEPETKARFYGGMYETPRYPQWRWSNRSRFLNGMSVSHAERLDEITLFVGGSRTADEGFRRNDSWRRYNGSVRVGYQFSAFESLTMLFSFLDQRRGNFLYWKDLENALVPKDDQLDYQVHSSRWMGGTQFNKLVSNDFFYAVRGSVYRTTWQDNIVSTLDPDGDRSTASFVTVEGQGTHKASGSHTLTFGVNTILNGVSADTIFGNHAGYGLAAYVQDEWDVGLDTRLVGGARYDMQHLDGLARVGQVNPKFGIVFRPTDFSTLRLSVGRGFRAPSAAEAYTTTEAGGLTVLPNRSLRPERSWSYEIGGSFAIMEWASIHVSAFQNEFWDLIEPTFGSDGNVRFSNVTRARVQGIETELNTSLVANRVLANIGYTYMFPRDVTRGDILRYRPRHLLYASAKGVVEVIEVGADFRYLSRVESIDEEFVLFGIVPQGDKRVPIAVVDARVGIDWKFVGLPVSSSFHVNNLLGYHYIELIGNIAPIRHYVLTMEAKL